MMEFVSTPKKSVGVGANERIQRVSNMTNSQQGGGLMKKLFSHLPVPYIYIYDLIRSSYLIYPSNWELGSKYRGNWKMRVSNKTAPWRRHDALKTNEFVGGVRESELVKHPAGKHTETAEPET